MDLIDIGGTLTTLVGQFTTEITGAAPTVLSAVVLVAGINLALRWVKKLAGQIG